MSACAAEGAYEVSAETEENQELRPTGISAVGEMPWGSHICLFYETNSDSLELLLPYMKAGLEEGEACLWVIPNQLRKEEAKSSLKALVPDLEEHFARHGLEILTHDEWYLREGSFDLQAVIERCTNKLGQALARGYSGLRLAGDASWVREQERDSFRDYEREVNRLIADQRLILLCTYQLAQSGAAKILDLARCHQVTLANRRGRLDVLETAGLERDQAQMEGLSDLTLKAIAFYASAIMLAIRRPGAQETLCQSEQASARARENLESLVQRRTADLREALAEVEHFSHTITHDLQSPLRAIWGLSELLTLRDSPLEPEETAKFLKQIKNSAQHMDHLIRDALEYKRADRQDLLIAPINPTAMLDSIIDASPNSSLPAPQSISRSPCRWCWPATLVCARFFPTFLATLSNLWRSERSPRSPLAPSRGVTWCDCGSGTTASASGRNFNRDSSKFSNAAQRNIQGPAWALPW